MTFSKSLSTPLQHHHHHHQHYHHNHHYHHLDLPDEVWQDDCPALCLRQLVHQLPRPVKPDLYTFTVNLQCTLHCTLYSALYCTLYCMYTLLNTLLYTLLYISLYSLTVDLYCTASPYNLQFTTIHLNCTLHCTPSLYTSLYFTLTYPRS